MAMTRDYLLTAGEMIGSAATLRDAVTLWRARDPDMRVVIVDAMDMQDEIPALELGKRRIDLATSTGHCWNITQQPEEATALILTQED